MLVCYTRLFAIMKEGTLPKTQYARSATESLSIYICQWLLLFSPVSSARRSPLHIWKLGLKIVLVSFTTKLTLIMCY